MMGGLTKTMRFTGNMSISEACKVGERDFFFLDFLVLKTARRAQDIREKTEEGGADHSLFRPPNELKHRKGQWLRGDRTFHFYDVISGEELHYRKRHRQMKVYLMDGQEKMMLIDESASIRDVCAEICEKLRLEKPYEEWSLTLGSTRAFLDPVLGLQEQGVTEADKVWLKKKHFWTDDKIDKSCPMNLTLMYHQARFGITHGEHFVTEEEAVSFAALQLQQENSKYNEAKHKPAVVYKAG
jgi:talin